MQEVKNTKKPLLYYFLIATLILMLLNIFVFPTLTSAKVTEVDYGTFLRMIDEKKIKEVEVTDTEIVFSDNEDQPNYYKTGKMDCLLYTSTVPSVRRRFRKPRLDNSGFPPYR